MDCNFSKVGIILLVKKKEKKKKYSEVKRQTDSSLSKERGNFYIPYLGSCFVKSTFESFLCV